MIIALLRQNSARVKFFERTKGSVAVRDGNK